MRQQYATLRNYVMCFELKSAVLCSSEQLGKMNVVSGGVVENNDPMKLIQPILNVPGHEFQHEIDRKVVWSHHSLLWSCSENPSSHKENSLAH